ncbi:MAG: DUF1648 domain-containing protein [Phycisphaerae bacterium]|nr:DUF1648 domain-containing protein [Phycisphaerae bacterium]
MNIKKTDIILVGIILLTVVVTAVLYPRLPEKMASHWNAKGEVDGYMNKLTAVWLMPVIMIVIILTFKLLPKIDPRKENYKKFAPYYDGFIIVFCLFLLSVQYFMLLWNLGIKLSVNMFVAVAVGLLFFYIGILCEHAKRNWFVGIRTPWTLSSDIVWDKTHKIGGKLFKAAGLVAIAGAFFSDYIMYFILIPVICVSMFTLIYSYIGFKREKAQSPS